MAKRSRRPTRGEPTASRPQASTESASTAAAGSSTTRIRPRRAREQTFFERYRTFIVGGALVVGLLIVGWIFFQGSAQAAYSCDTMLTPGPVESVTPRPPTPTPTAIPSPSPTASPTPSGSPTSSGSPTPSGSPTASPSPSPSATPVPTPEPEPTARLGFTTTVMGREHIRDLNTSINYAFCPPTSGDHFNTTNKGPIRAGVYPKTEEQIPGGWIHNLEHGYTVALYRCTGPDDCPSDAEMAVLNDFYDQATFSENQACSRKVVVARFDSMDNRFAMLAWGRALLMDEFDLDTALTFAQQWTDHDAVPERGIC